MVTNVVVYLSVCSMVGLHIVMSKVGDDKVTDHQSVRGWSKVFDRIVDVNANETVESKRNISDSAMYSYLVYGLRATNGSNSSEGGRRIRGQKNNTGIPFELFFQWWSIVRPFGNEMVTRPEFPWMAAVQFRRGQYSSHLCSGNILTKLHVVTTCRCLSIPTGSEIMPLATKDPSSISIVAGISMLDIPLKEQLMYGQIRNAVGINIHPHCSINHKYDFGVIELDHYLYFTNRVLPIPNPFDAFRYEKATKSHTGYVPHPLMQDGDVCQAAGWQSDRIFGDDPAKSAQKVNDFQVVSKNNCFGSNPQFENQWLCTKIVGGETWKSWNGQTGDTGSGLVCRDRVVGILSHTSGNHVVFSNLRPVLSFLWQYYQDQNEVYAMKSSGRLAVLSWIVAVHVPFVFHL